MKRNFLYVIAVIAAVSVQGVFSGERESSSGSGENRPVRWCGTGERDVRQMPSEEQGSVANLEEIASSDSGYYGSKKNPDLRVRTGRGKQGEQQRGRNNQERRR